MKKKLLKWLGITIGISIPIIPILALINYNSSEKAIFASGSSSILPLMQKYSEVYTDSEIVPTGGGSGKGLDDAVNANTDLGNMSSNKKTSILSNKVYFDGWNQHENRTVTIAQDAEVIALNIPNDLTNYKVVNNLPKVRPWAVANIYSTKAGTTTWGDLLEGPIKGNSVNSIVQAYGRNGGKYASGTSDGFFNILENFADYAKPKINLDEAHSSPIIRKTPESNAQAYDVLNEKNNYGITYLSLGYLDEILKQPNQSNNNIKLGFVDTQSGNEKDKTTGQSEKTNSNWGMPTIENAKTGDYGWIRPYNVAFSIINANKHQYIYDFLKFVLSDKGQTYAKEMLLVPLNQGAKDGSSLGWLYQKDNLEKSDSELLNIQNGINYAYGWQGKHV